MKHYRKTSDQSVHALDEDGSQDFLKTDDMVLMTPEEVEAHVNPVPPYSAVKAELLGAFRTAREEYLNRLAGIGLDAQVKGLTEIVDGVLAFRQGLLDLPTSPGILAATDGASLKLAIVAEYNALVAATPTPLKISFWKVNFVG